MKRGERDLNPSLLGERQMCYPLHHRIPSLDAESSLFFCVNFCLQTREKMENLPPKRTIMANLIYITLEQIIIKHFALFSS